jgi:PKD repeat protein
MPDITGTNYILANDLSGPLTVSQTPTNNSILPLGTNVVVITVADASGNTAFSTNFIVVQDQTPPLILSQPQNQTNLIGAAAGFSVAATACTPLAYQWFFNSAALSNQTNSTLTLISVNLTNAGNYSVTVTASGGSTNSTVAMLTIYNPAPVIASAAANPGGSFTLNLAGAPGSTYVLQTTTNLAPVIIWLPIATNTLDASGVWQFTDPQAVNFQQQFYRLELSQ